MKALLQRLFEHQTLSREEARLALSSISDGEVDGHQAAAFLTVFNMRKIQVEELMGFRDCLQERCTRIDLTDFDPIDLCGTGGDGKDTFNISTLASFVAAGAGMKVAKHGNYGVSSSCGSSNVMEHLGYRFTNDPDAIKRQIDRAGICFLHAPLFHPAMKAVAPVRRALKVRTFFNMLGPMVNPSFPQKQLVGVFSPELQRYYKYIYEQGSGTYRIVHALDGYDEVSLTGAVKVVKPKAEQILNPADFQTSKVTAESLYGGRDVPEAAAIFTAILEGRGTEAQQAAVVSNAALALQCGDSAPSLEESIGLARESLQSGKALHTFKTMLET